MERRPLEKLLDMSSIEVPDPPSAIGVGKDGDPRLIISQIVNTNFKSYEGRKVVGPFHKAFTSIIGPNGSGKSNVIDSMLFVFGYRAQKIRNKKLSGLIHQSAGRQNIYECSVEVHFCSIIDDCDDPDEYEIVPNSEFTVSRTAYRDNSSSYSINGAKTTFKEVGKLLRQKGIDLDHNRFLILQGEVEQISMMKPKGDNPNDEGMLEYLEDIIGSSRLKPLIEILNQDVEELADYKSERLNRVQLAEQERDKLKSDYQKARDWLEIKNKLTSSSNKLYQIEIFRNATKRSQLKEKNVEIRKSKSEIEEVLKSEREKNEDIYKSFKKSQKKKVKVDNHLAANKDKQNELEGKNAELFEEKKLKKKRRIQVEKDLEKENADIVKFTEMPAKCAQLEEELTSKIEDLEKTELGFKKDLEKHLEKVEKETEVLRKRKIPLETNMLNRQEIVNSKAAELSEAKHVQASFTEEYDRAKIELDKIELNLKNAQKELDENNDEVDQLNSEIPSLEADLNAKECKLGPLLDERSHIQEDVADLQVKLHEMKVSGGETKQNSKLFDYIVNYLKRKNLVSGIYGRLGDLGGIDRKYDVAISSSCNLDIVVVDTTVQGKQIMEYLNKDNIGSATIFALDKLQPIRRAVEGLPAPRLVDLIRCEDPKLMNAFYRACADTVVCTDSIQAEEIALNYRHRAVSLNGEVAETTGTISGGGRPRSGAMGERPTIKIETNVATEHEIEQMENEIDRLRTSQRDIDDEIRSLRNQIGQIKSDLPKALNRKDQLENQQRTLDEKISILNGRFPDQEKLVASLKPDEDELLRIDDRVREAELEHGASLAELESAKDKVDELNEKMLEIGQKRIEGTKKQINTTKEKIKTSKNKIVKIQNDAKTAGRKLESATKKKEDLETELTELENRKKQIKDDVEKLSKEFDELLDDQTELNEAKTEIDTDLEKLTKQIEVFEAKAEEEKAKIHNFEIQINDNLNQIRSIEDAIKIFQKRRSELKMREIDAGDDLTLIEYTNEEIESMKPDLDELRVEISVTAEHDASCPNLRVILHYRERNSIYNQRVTEFEIVNKGWKEKRELRNSLARRRTNEFNAGFESISEKVKQMYQMITLGGDAELELVNSLAPFEDGVVFTVRPPKKSWKNIWNLSGGEKTLASLSLVFALHIYKPTPLYVMDEIDAALDIKNVSIVAHYLRERTKNAQFIIISLRSQMFSLASKLIGVYKTNDTTKTISYLNKVES